MLYLAWEGSSELILKYWVVILAKNIEAGVPKDFGTNNKQYCSCDEYVFMINGTVNM